MNATTVVRLSEPYARSLEEAVAWIRMEYSPLGIVASGSIIRGNPDPHSDFDIHVVTEGVRQRVQKFFNGIPCEIF